MVLLFLAFSSVGWAQTNDAYTPAKLTLPSPTAASLGVIGVTTVGYYTGAPDISIPLYEIKTKNHSVPITLQYNSSGTRVGENASWVGMGWSFVAGGVITKTIRGLDDFGNNGYATSGAIPPYSNPPLEADRPYFNEMLKGRNDGDPDIISYNFGKYSGRFVIGKNVDGKPIYMDDQNNLKVVRTGEKWLVVDPKGYKYYFGSIESGDGFSYSGTSELTNVSAFKQDLEGFVNTATYLDSIVSPTKEVVKFIYERQSKSYSLINKTEMLYNLLQLSGGCPNNTVDMPAFIESYTASRQLIRDVNLKQIVFASGRIDFITTDREDIEYSGTVKPGKLSEIIVRDLGGKQIKRYVLAYSYFGAANITGRLKLDKVTEYGADGTQIAPYEFTYFNGLSVPPKESKSIDHWGYYNGKNNNQLVPSRTVFYNSPMYFPGADRTPDSLANYPMAGVLSAISYPTGAKTTFEFELNDYSNPQGKDRYGKIPRVANAAARPGNEHVESSITFTINDTLNVSLDYGYLKVDENANSIKNVQTEFVYLYSPGGFNESWGTWPCPSEPDPTCGMDSGTRQYRNRVLLPGTYRLEVRYLQGYSTSARVTWDEKVLLARRKGGGLRIKSIANFDNGQKINVRKFDYTSDGKTTGFLIQQPAYAFTTSAVINPGNVSCSTLGTYLGRSSSSTFAPGLNASAIVGYSKVTEFIGENGEGGKNEYFYHNSGGFEPPFPHIPYVTDALNGKPALTLTYNAAGKLVKKVAYEYDRKAVANLRGVKLYQPPVISGYPNSGYTMQYYDNISTWKVLKRETESEFDGDNNETVKAVKDYAYDNHLHKEISKMDLKTSTGLTSSTLYKYPQDVTGSVSTSLIDDGQIGVVLEQNQVRNGASMKTKFEYALDSRTGFVLPNLVKSVSSLDDLEEVRLRYHNYDIKGNVLSIAKELGPRTNYVWSYNSQYPIAMIDNAEYAQIESLLGGPESIKSFAAKVMPTDTEINAFLAPLRNPANLQGVAVNTFTYYPLIGLSTQTDAKGLTNYYEYDVFQRLKYIRDHKNNIIKSFQYIYKNTPGIPVPDPVFKSAAVSRVFTKNNCPAGQLGSSVTYALPEGAYTSNTQLEADNKALADVNANGQNYANTNGSCSIICSGDNKKIINGVCETGRRINTNSQSIGNGSFRCTYHYQWSDGSVSRDYTEINRAHCLVID